MAGLVPGAGAAPRPAGETFRLWNIGYFSPRDGLLADPSRFRREAAAWGEPRRLDGEGFLGELETHAILIGDREAYLERFQAKRSPLDWKHQGTYHQELGQQLRLVERVDPEQWWVRQKFTEDQASFRPDTLYAAVQERFLDGFLPRRLGKADRVLDLGCGPGVITARFAGPDREVLGIDPNPRYIEIARRRERPGLRFEVRPIGAEGALADLPTGGFDLIFMSDALLFYFVPVQPADPPSLERLLGELRRLLRPGGAFLSMEPHPVFYIQPWLGDPQRPFTVVTEYLQTRWRINPPFGRLVQPFLQGGFVLRGLEEVRATGEAGPVGERAMAFAREFPLWTVLDFERREGP